MLAMKPTAFWAMTTCSLVDTNVSVQHFAFLSSVKEELCRQAAQQHIA
jgi:hypothetical protein